MYELRLEYGDPINPTNCDCCGNTSNTVTGFIYNDDFAHGVYFGRWTDGHLPKEIKLTICIGEWGEGSNPNNRDSINLRIRGKEEGFRMMITDSIESPWKENSILGNFMDRQEALNSKYKTEFLRIAEKVISNVPEIINYLN